MLLFGEELEVYIYNGILLVIKMWESSLWILRRLTRSIPVV
jgi:hypothetical protein